MPLAREQLAVLAAETVNKLLAALEQDRLVARFVDTYVADYRRRGLKAHPLRYRELLSTINREALLAMVAEANAELPRYLRHARTHRGTPGARPQRSASGGMRAAEAQAADTFLEEFFSRLAGTLRWTEADAEEFHRDLDLYAQLALGRPKPGARRAPPQPAEGPFADRCALLLDPSMLPEARRVAGKFQAEIEHVTQRILASVFRPHRFG